MFVYTCTRTAKPAHYSAIKAWAHPCQKVLTGHGASKRRVVML